MSVGSTDQRTALDLGVHALSSGRFFFFQAEDGIRDADVTGVQTCALPISQVMGVTQRMGARVVLEVGLPMVMYRRPGARAQNARVLHRLVATLGMDLIRGQEIGRASCRERV